MDEDSSVYTLPSDASMATGSSGGARTASTLSAHPAATEVPSTVTATRPDDDDVPFESVSGIDIEGLTLQPEPERLRLAPGVYVIRTAAPDGWALDMYGFHGAHNRDANNTNKVALFPANADLRENVNQRWVVAPAPGGPPDAYTIAPFCCAARGMQLALVLEDAADGRSVGRTVIRLAAAAAAPGRRYCHTWRFLLAVQPQQPQAQQGDAQPQPQQPLRVHIRSTDPSPRGFEKANLGHELTATGASMGRLANAAVNIAAQRAGLAETGASTRDPRQVFVLTRQDAPTEAQCRAAGIGRMSPPPSPPGAAR